MRYLKNFPPVSTKVIQISAATKILKSQLPNNLRSPKANQTLKGYLKTNANLKVLLFFKQLLRENPSAINSYSLLFTLKACTQIPHLSRGQQLHTIAKKLGFEPIVFLQTCLIDFYSVLGNLNDAHHMFDEIPCKNTVCWTCLVSAYVNNHKPTKALKLFRQMQLSDVEPDRVTLTVALSACASLGALAMGEWIHGYIRRKNGLGMDLSLNNALLIMYAKCGDVGTAQRLFDSIRNKDVKTWTSMIVGYAVNGRAEEALELFAEMTCKSGDAKLVAIPNDVTFLGVLMACSHGGRLEEGKRYFKTMIEDYGLKPSLPHFGCMVDLLCRAQLVEEAYDLILGMPMQPTAVVWRTLLGACFLHGNVELGAEVRDRLLALEPTHAGDDVALSNIFAAKELWNEKLMARDRVKYARRVPGCSSIEVGIEIDEFVAADNQSSYKGSDI
ncbi:hypothetical protein Ancab_038837 [Ancistrocladus abbreviatus]